MPPGDQLTPFTFLTSDDEGGVSETSGAEISDINLDDVLAREQANAQASGSAGASSSSAPDTRRTSQSSSSAAAVGRRKKGYVARKTASQPPRGARPSAPAAGPSTADTPVSSSTRRKSGVGTSRTNAISLISSDEEDVDATPITRKPPSKPGPASARRTSSASPTKPSSSQLPPSSQPAGSLTQSSKFFSGSQAKSSQASGSKYSLQELELPQILVPSSSADHSTKSSQKDKEKPRSKSRTASTPAAPRPRTQSPSKPLSSIVAEGEAGPGPSTMAHTSALLDRAIRSPPPSVTISSPRRVNAAIPVDLPPIPVSTKRQKSPSDALDALGREKKKSKDDHLPHPAPAAGPSSASGAATIAALTAVPFVSAAKKGPIWATAQSQRTPSPLPPPPAHLPLPPPTLPPPLPQSELAPSSNAMDGVDELYSSTVEMDVDTDSEVVIPTEDKDEEGGVGGDAVGETPAKDLLRMLGLPSGVETPSEGAGSGTEERIAPPRSPPPPEAEEVPVPQMRDATPTVDPPAPAPIIQPQCPPSVAAVTASAPVQDQPTLPLPDAESAAPPTLVEVPKRPLTFTSTPLDLPQLIPLPSRAQVPSLASAAVEDEGMELDTSGWEIPTEMTMDGSPVEEEDTIEAPTGPDTAEMAVEKEIEDVRTEVGDIDIGGDTNSRSSSIVHMTREEVDQEHREKMADPAFQEYLAEKGMTMDEWLDSKPKSVVREGSVLDITEERAARRARTKKVKKERSEMLQKRIKPKMTREEWRRMIEMADDFEVDQLVSPHSPSPSGAALSTGSTEGVDTATYLSTHRHSPAAGSTRGLTPLPVTFEPSEQPAPGRRGKVLRVFDTEEIDRWNRLLPTISARGAVLRMIFESWISEATASDDPSADPIRVVNTVDAEDLPPDMEFQYSNRMMYHSQVPDPELGTGCGCDGPCDLESRTCSCVKRQQLYNYNTEVKGFAYDGGGCLKNDGIPIWECGPLCGCPPECINRVIQRGRSANTKIDLFKTRQKGWGIKARVDIPQGTFLGVYSGELITERESERRGEIYDEIGRTYLFDLDGWQIRNPPPLDKLRELDPRLAELAERAYNRSLDAADENDKNESIYSAYSVDAFHWGFTRYFNHSCDPNLAISQAYVTDCNPERPMLVIFTRKPVKKNDELCISYKGIDDPEELEYERRKYEAAKAKKPKPLRGGGGPGKGKRRTKTKSSASAHINNLEKTSLVKDTCKCGAWNCDGRMWGAALASGSDEGDEDDDDY